MKKEKKIVQDYADDLEVELPEWYDDFDYDLSDMRKETDEEATARIRKEKIDALLASI